MFNNSTIQDLAGSILAFVLFPLVSVIPGYVFGWVLNVFEFRSRLRLTKYTIGMVLSNAILPIFSYLIYRLLSAYFLFSVLFLITTAFIVIDIIPLFKQLIFSHSLRISSLSCLKKSSFIQVGLWIVLSFFLLVDLQIGNKLYFTNVAYDYTTRIAVINAITRTGVPPLNPTYYPGHSEQLTYLYYYWYISPSIIDQIGGNLVSSRQALIASVSWCGLCMMATTALYLRLRNNHRKEDTWSAPFIGIQLFSISGIDVVPVLLITIGAKIAIGQMIFNGRIESWNMPIMSWLNAVTWVPNHVSAALQCITAMMVISASVRAANAQRFIAGIIAGLSFASALGSSIWVTLMFAVAWMIWAAVLFMSKKTRGLTWAMIIAGLLGAGLSIPFIVDLIKSGGNSVGGLPVSLYVRPFILGALLFPKNFQPIANFFFLPLNYFMELGFFLAMGLYWFKLHKNHDKQNHPFTLPEIIVLITVMIVLSFVYSTVIKINDLGIRAWLLGQFVLLIWAVDVIQSWLGKERPFPHSIFNVIGNQPKIGKTLQILLILGLLTTVLEALSTRIWPILIDWNVAGFPNDLSPDTNLGSRTYDAKLAYEYINTNLPAESIIQNNPDIILDRPSGLYGERQMAIADRVAYGVPQNTFKSIQSEVATIFTSDTSWNEIDTTCKKYSIDALVINDLDPIWKRLPDLETERIPLYQNQYYTVIQCGNYAIR